MSIRKNTFMVFFDGDGTIWYPKSTKRTTSPYWIYSDTNSTKINKLSLKHLVLSKTSLSTLKRIKKMGIKVVLLSTHPHPPRIAIKVLKDKLKHLKILDVFDEYYPTRGSKEAKGKKILSILKERNIPKKQALMVGDSYHYDYLSAKMVGVKSLLIRTAYMKYPARGQRVKRLIDEIKDVLKFI